MEYDECSKTIKGFPYSIISEGQLKYIIINLGWYSVAIESILLASSPLAKKVLMMDIGSILESERTYLHPSLWNNIRLDNL